MSEAIVIDTPEGIEHYRICAIISALRIEVKTGLQMTRFSAIKASRTYGTTGRTKKQVLAEMEDLYEALYGGRFGS